LSEKAKKQQTVNLLLTFDRPGQSPSQWFMDQFLADKRPINPGVAPPDVALLFLLAQNE
jgi:hypothetical protein